MEKQVKRVGTHSGTFHADDVFAYVFLKELFGEFELIRTRDEDLLSTCDIVFDVGGGKFDHHTTAKTYRDGIPYAASGLIWREFGREIIAKHVADEEAIEKIFAHIDYYFIQGMDALDNGVELEKSIPIPDITSIIRGFNPGWESDENEDEAFLKAAEFGAVMFQHALKSQLGVYRAKDYIQECYNKREKKEILVLERSISWIENLLKIDPEGEVLFAVYPDSNRGWKIQVVPKVYGSYDARKSLPSSWAGLKDEEFSKETGISDGIFCHPARFIAGTESKESALKLAQIAVENRE